MIFRKAHRVFIGLAMLLVAIGQSQELPPVSNFDPNVYNAGNQNWMIDGGGDGTIYFANSTGLLEYTGENWNLYPVPNNTIVRSLKVVGDRVYTGAYMEAGYWQRNDFGELEYTSLGEKYEDLIGDGEQFWDIEFLEDLVIFRSFGGIYIYDPEADDFRKFENSLQKPISGIFKLEDKLYFQLVGDGLFKIANGNQQKIISSEILGERAIIHIYQEDTNLGIVTATAEFFTWNERELQKKFTSEIEGTNILDVVDLPDGSMMLATIGKGVVELNASGNILKSFNQDNVLLNNTVLDLYLDENENVWAGLDYGISLIDPGSAFRSFQDIRGEIGSVYDAYEENGNLYLGTNQGLYLKTDDSDDYELIPGTNGQVWFVNNVDGHVFCGHNSGTFLVNGNSAIKISDRLGTWVVKKYQENLFVQGHYNGISFLQENNGKFETLPLVEGFPHSSKFIEVSSENEIWISNEHKGVFRLQPNEDLSGLKKLKNYNFTEESGITSSIFKFQDTLFYSSKEKVYAYDKNSDAFSDANSISRAIGSFNRLSGKMLANEGEIWGFTSEGVFKLESSQLDDDLELKKVYIGQQFRNIAVGYENISGLNDDSYLLGIANGYIRFENPESLNQEIGIKINQIEVSALDSREESISLSRNGQFDFEKNNITFLYSTPVHEKFLLPEYSYRLVGLSEGWSDWNKNSSITFKNLNFGDYRFEVRAKVGDQITEPVSYDFEIDRPAYLSTLALMGYFLLFIALLILLLQLNKRYHRRKIAENERALKVKNLEAEQEIIKLQNEKLEQDMTNKNRELAVSTMSLIKKNEFLTSIREQLKDEEESSNIKSVIKTIDKDINEEDNWKFFKKAFNNADKDFLKKMKDKHPELTSSDLKLCAYLRLNLSSKEIAPLLNISVKSVEIKRYRLRKKMDLDRNVNLTDYILQV